jgi:3-oxoacyl-[acyl-carrier-protein] synthase II
MTERILVTGYGVVSPFGRGADTLHQGMVAGESKVEPLPEPRGSLQPGYGGLVTLGARDIRKLPNSRNMRPGTMTRYTFLSTLALGDAMAQGDSPWDDGDGALRRGLYVASYTNSDRFDKYVRFAHHVSAEEDGKPTIVDARVPQAIRKFSSFEFLKLMNNMPAAHGGIHGRCQGPCNTFLGTPSGGIQAIGRAAAVIRDGLADTMYAGGVGTSVHDHMMMTRATRGLASASGLEPGAAGRPFDRGATGIVPGEAGGMLVLERESTATARGAKVFAELAGYGEWFAPPATTRGLPGSPAGGIRAMRRALQRAGLEAGDVDLVVAHGEGRTDLDALEASALAEVLGPKAGSVPVLSLTAHIGAAEAAAGPVGAAVALECMRTGQIPGALNREDPLPEYKGPSGSAAIDADVKVALVSLVTREGINAAVVLRRVD